jgi:arylsulfatase A-like enzyme
VAPAPPSLSTVHGSPAEAKSGEPARVTTPSAPPPPRLAAFHEACALGAGAAIVGSIPAALRAARAGGSFFGGWLGSAAVLLPVLVLTCLASHAAGRGFRMVTGNRAGRSTATGLALWIGLVAPVLVVLGAVLKSATHHRGLGGATFGVLALLVAIGLALVAKRLLATGRWLVERGVSPRAVAVGFAVLSVAPLSFVALPLLGANDAGQQTPLLAATVFDVLIFGLAAAVAATFDLPAQALEHARRRGAFAAGGVFLLGALWLSMSSTLGAAMKSGGGLAATMMVGLERWTDRDGDGVGAYFGGNDCDEGDPSIHPGAADPPGDGVDQDCDGKDGPAKAADGAVAVVDAAPTANPTSAAAASVPSAPLTSKPSVVLITLDTVRADHTEPYGYAKKTTPRLSALASRGTVFEHAYATATDTQRALVPFVSGRRFEQTAKDRRQWPTLSADVDTLAERMKAAGYATAGVSSFTWTSRERAFDQGFESWTEVFADEHPERGVTGPLAVRAARAAIEKTNGDPRPLFLWVHLFDAHAEYKHHEGLDFGRGKMGAYDGEIAFVDGQLGDIVDAVAASPRGKSTAIIVVGSQGEGFDEHDSSGHGKELYDETLRVPMIVALPGDSVSRRFGARAVSTLDVAATVAELGGAKADGLGGTSVLPLARGDEGKGREAIYAHMQGKRAIVDWPMKLIAKKHKGKLRHLLFDLSVDPGETKDLSESRGDDLKRLAGLLDAFESSLGVND